MSSPTHTTLEASNSANAFTASRCWARQLLHQMAIVSMKTTLPARARSAIRNSSPVVTSTRVATAQGWLNVAPAGLGVALGSAVAGVGESVGPAGDDAGSVAGAAEDGASVAF